MRPSSILKKLTLSATTFVLVLVAAELVARLAEPGPFTLWDRNPYLPDDRVHHVHRPDFKGRWDGTWYETNSLGLRGPELPGTKEDDEFRVVALGDSCTFGKGVLESETWPRRLEALLAEDLAPGRKALVANLGVNGYSGRAYLTVYRDLAPALEPDLVVLGYNLNDFPNVVKEVDREVFQGKKSLRARIPGDVRNALGRFALYRWLRATYYELNETRDRATAERIASETQSESPENQERLARARRDLVDLVTEVRAGGAELVVFLFPYESQVYQDVFDDSPIRWLRGVCEEEGVVYVDVLTAFRKAAAEEGSPPLFLRGDRYHPSPEGYAIVAREVRAALVRENLLPGADG